MNGFWFIFESELPVEENIYCLKIFKIVWNIINQKKIHAIVMQYLINILPVFKVWTDRIAFHRLKFSFVSSCFTIKKLFFAKLPEYGDRTK